MPNRNFAPLTSLCFSGKSTDLKPLSAKPGKVLFEDSFGSGTRGQTWQIMKVDWQVKDGAITGREKKEENHFGVLLFNVPNHNAAQPTVPIYYLTSLWVAPSWNPKAQAADLGSYRQVARDIVAARQDPNLHLVEGPA